MTTRKLAHRTDLAAGLIKYFSEILKLRVKRVNISSSIEHFVLKSVTSRYREKLSTNNISHENRNISRYTC